jgi:hypothetical protein
MRQADHRVVNKQEGQHLGNSKIQNNGWFNSPGILLRVPYSLQLLAACGQDCM